MAQSTTLDATQLEKPYTFFLFKSLTGIYEAWDEGNPEQSLKRALRLVVFLPTDIKKALWNKKIEIHKEFASARRLQGSSWFSSQKARNTASLQIAIRHLEPFVDEMVKLLDDKGWLEKGALRPRFDKTRKLKV